jgi:hypothetical protein
MVRKWSGQSFGKYPQHLVQDEFQTNFLWGSGGADPDWIRIQSGQWIQIQIRFQECRNDPQKKYQEILCFEVLDVLFRGLKLRRPLWRPRDKFIEIFNQKNI